MARATSLRPDERRLLDAVTRQYLESGDFNGLATDKATTLPVVVSLIRKGLISLVRADTVTNPHVKSFPVEAPADQVAKIREAGIEGCLYPEPAHLSKVLDRSPYEGRPFSLDLALGEPQLGFRVFDLSVLEQYRNDPRYFLLLDDTSGMISINDDATESIEPRHQTLLQTFGFAYDDNFNRAVAVFLRYLHDLTPEHQRLWEARRVDGEFKLHPNYFRSSILGQFPDRMPIHVAFTEELHQINAYCRLMGRPPLFRREFRERERPREFTFLLRPTLRALNDYVHLLDKMLSDNIDDAFFMDEVETVRVVARKDGTADKERKGTIQLLDEWLSQVMRFPDPGPKDEMIATLRRIRKVRQKPAHSVAADAFDPGYFKQQRQLIIDAYKAVRVIRLILANHPATKAHELPRLLERGAIIDY